MEFSHDQQLAIYTFNKGLNMFLTGPGGSGKSHLIRYFRKKSIENKKKIAITAMTGVAAINLECKARTLHSWAGIKLGKDPIEKLIQTVKYNKNACRNWRKTDILIIDEVSMLGQSLLEKLDSIAKTLRKSVKPFGGIQLVFSGDFFQLPPVGDEFAFKSEVWNSLNLHNIELTTIHRQKDPTFQDILNKIRRAEWDESMIDIFEKRLIEPDGQVKPTRVFPTNSRVNTINEDEYDSLKGEERTYECKVKVDFVIPPGDAEKIEKEIENMKKNLSFWESLPLKIGTQVMLIHNLDLDKGLVNGSRGIVTGMFEEMVLVKFHNGIEEYISYHEWEHDEIDGLTINALPLVHAWATSIHKAQGISIDSIQIDIGNSVFEYGQAYVALSRVRTLEGLYILSMNPSKIKAHPDVISFYKDMKRVD